MGFGLRAVAVSMFLLLQAGCEEDLSFYIYQNQVPETGCSISVNETEYRPQGILDVSLGSGYVLFPLLRSDLQKLGKGDTPDPNQLHLREFRVSLDVGSTINELSPEELRFSHPTSGVLLPGDKRASAVEIIPSGLLPKLKVDAGARPMVIAEVRAVAETGDGQVLESLPFFYPVSLCKGCLVVTLKTCPTGTGAGVSSNVCGLPQDDPLVCCTDSALGFHCLAGN